MTSERKIDEYELDHAYFDIFMRNEPSEAELAWTLGHAHDEWGTLYLRLEMVAERLKALGNEPAARAAANAAHAMQNAFKHIELAADEATTAFEDE